MNVEQNKFTAGKASLFDLRRRLNKDAPSLRKRRRANHTQEKGKSQHQKTIKNEKLHGRNLEIKKRRSGTYVYRQMHRVGSLSYLSSHLISILPSGRKGAARTLSLTCNNGIVNHKSKSETDPDSQRFALLALCNTGAKGGGALLCRRACAQLGGGPLPRPLLTEILEGGGGFRARGARQQWHAACGHLQAWCAPAL